MGRASDGRIHAIDAIRGFCLLNIFVNHSSIGFVKMLSPSRILFFDSADVFVLLAGISMFLAYGPRPGDEGGIAIGRILRRCRTIYFANLLVILCSVVILLIAAQWSVEAAKVVTLLREHGVGYAWHLVTLQQSVAYSLVLRLYVFLLLFAPLYFWLAARRFWYPLVLGVAVWLPAGHFGWTEHDSLTGDPLILTVLPWNLPFALGIAMGAAMRQGVKLPRSRIAVGLAAALLLAGPVCFAIAARLSPDVMVWIDTRDDSFWLAASKRFQSPLRVASLIAGVWLFIALARAPVVRLVHQVSPNNVFCALGRQSLTVYAVGAIGAVAIHQGLVAVAQTRPALAPAAESVAIAIGFGVMIWVAKADVMARLPKLAALRVPAQPAGSRTALAAGDIPGGR